MLLGLIYINNQTLSDGCHIVQECLKPLSLDQNLDAVLNKDTRVHVLRSQLTHFLLPDVEIFGCLFNGQTKFVLGINTISADIIYLHFVLISALIWQRIV